MEPHKNTESIEDFGSTQIEVENPLVEESESTSEEANIEGMDNLGSVSATSTERFVGQIPFEALKVKVYDLCLLIFADRKHGGLRIDRIKGGSFNRVVAVTVLPSENIRHTGPDVVTKEQAYVVRVQRYVPSHDEMEYDIAALEFATAHVDLPIPKLHALELSPNNHLDKPYSIQTRLPGTNAQSLFNDLNLEQRKSFLLQVMDVHTKIHAITSNSAGHINRSTVADPSNLIRFEIPPTYHSSPTVLRIPATSPQTTYEWIMETCSRWSAFLGEDVLGTETVWIRFQKIAVHLRELGFLPDAEKFHLCHLDLMPRNLLVRIVDETRVEITGVLDWDSEYVHFCPKFVAYRAPSWMWIPNPRLAAQEQTAILTPDDPQFLAVKSLFDSMAGEEWLRYAYAPEYMIARRMFKILRTGACLPRQFEEAYNIIRDWNILHPGIKVPSMELTPKISGGESDSSEEFESGRYEGNDS